MTFSATRKSVGRKKLSLDRQQTIIFALVDFTTFSFGIRIFSFGLNGSPSLNFTRDQSTDCHKNGFDELFGKYNFSVKSHFTGFYCHVTIE